jgi:Asp-tRNA(Asn)/Glu-tRNA(Gln) amidotransferase A subunit family amidase
VSIEGIVPLAPSLDHPGPMARTVADAAALLACMAAAPAVTSLSSPPAPLGALATGPRPGDRPLEGLRVALTSHATSTSWEDEVADGFDLARAACEALGARIVELPAPCRIDDDDLTVVLLTELWHYHRRFADRADRHRPSIAELVEAGSKAVDAGAYLAAQARRAEGTRAWQAFFADERTPPVIWEPTLPVLPPRRGEGYARGHAGGAGDPLIALTALWGLTGMPVVSLPVSAHVGVSLIGPLGAEAAVVRVGVDLQERALPPPELGWPSG